MPRSVHKAPCWALQGRAALPGEGGWGGLTVGLQACNTAHGLGPTQFSAKFLVTGKLLFQNLQVILDLLSLSFPRSFCFINNQVLKILPSKYFSKWPLLSTWLHWTSAVYSPCCSQPPVITRLETWFGHVFPPPLSAQYSFGGHFSQTDMPTLRNWTYRFRETDRKSVV